MDSEKVIGDLEGLTWDDWHEWHSDSEVRQIAKEAIALLKEQEEQIGVLKRAITQRPKPVKLLDVFGNGYAKVVRCKDCRYCTIAADKKWRQDFGKSIYECDHKGLCYVEPDWFCADGERRDDDGE